MDCGAVYIGHEGGASVHLLQDHIVDIADTGSHGSLCISAGTSAYAFPAGDNLHFHPLNRDLLQVQGLKKAGETF